MKRIGKELKTGLFAVIVVVATVFLINYLRGEGLWSKSKDLFVCYDNVEGVKTSCGVYIDGFKTGTVDDIRFDKEKSRFVLRLHIVGDFDVTSDAKAVIYSSDILGGKSIKIVNGPSSVLAKSKDFIAGEVESDELQKLIKRFSNVGSSIDLLIAAINITIMRVNDLLNDGNRADVAAAIAEIRMTAENVKAITDGIKVKTPEIQEIIGEVHDVTTNLKSSSEKLDTTLSNISDISENLKEAELKETVAELKQLIEKINDSDGTIGKLISTDSLHNSVNSLVCDLDSLVKKIEENPKKYLKLSVF